MTMPPLADVYRSHAEKEHAFAAVVTLPNVRAIHEKSAERWLQLAEQAGRAGAARRP